ncbi:MAG TPA: hypothetical protein VKA94_09795 [Hyphomicrobiales bacterium]|nr:hypothetical protein [Hyphomicrobiales bacterium]
MNEDGLETRRPARMRSLIKDAASSGFRCEVADVWKFEQTILLPDIGGTALIQTEASSSEFEKIAA